MKKVTAIYFVLLANMIILAHTVIPHLHLPNQTIVFSAHHNHEHDKSEHKDNTHRHSHSHGGDYDHDFCLLKQAVSTFANSTKQNLITPYINFISGNTSAILVKNDYSCNPPPLLLGSLPSTCNSHHTCLINSATGLRAPPTF